MCFFFKYKNRLNLPMTSRVSFCHCIKRYKLKKKILNIFGVHVADLDRVALKLCCWRFSVFLNYAANVRFWSSFVVDSKQKDKMVIFKISIQKAITMVFKRTYGYWWYILFLANVLINVREKNPSHNLNNQHPLAQICVMF